MEESTSSQNGEGKGLLSRSEIPEGEHPLSLGKTSVRNQFFQDTEIIEQIDRDVKRTHADMHFFSGDSASVKSNQNALKNILIIYVKLNPGIRYVQGMNELLAPLYYVFKNDPDEDFATLVSLYMRSLKQHAMQVISRIEYLYLNNLLAACYNEC